MVNGVDSWKITTEAKILIDESIFAPDCGLIYPFLNRAED
jgi:hypothetical protein